MPRISVVVPIYNVEEYLAPCLDSVLAQKVTDYEVLMVDDGSTDASAAVAAAYAERDERFKLISQENGGLSKARNTGIDAATGEFLQFVDSDDMLTPEAFELLLGALEETESDFATGNVQRFTRWGVSQTAFLARAFRRTRLETHITQSRSLLADRTAWNKLFRRAFWDRHGFRFPEGRVHEDIPVILPAHFKASSVDVIADPVYLYRLREYGALSITQRRLEKGVLLDRLSAVQTVREFLAAEGLKEPARWYDESIVADDIRYFVNVLDRGDDEYRALFFERVNALLDDLDESVYERLPAIDRLKYHLVRRRQMPELAEVLRFQREELRTTPPVRIAGHWYGDYPFRDDARVGVPRSVYKLDRELSLTARIEDLRLEDGKLKVKGFAFVDGVGAPHPGSQKVSVTALRPGRFKRVRHVIARVALKTVELPRADVNAKIDQQACDLTWSGFEATLDPRKLRRPLRARDRTWELYVTVRAGRVQRRGLRFNFEPARPLPAVELPAGGGAIAIAGTAKGKVVFSLRRVWSRVRATEVEDGGVLALDGEWRVQDEEPNLSLVRRRDEKRVPVAIEQADPGRAEFRGRVPLKKLRGAAANGDPDVWDLWSGDEDDRRRVAVRQGAPLATWRNAKAEVRLRRNHLGNAVVDRLDPHAVVTAARWTGGATLELEGELPHDGPYELALEAGDTGETHVFPVERRGASGFAARLPLDAIESLAGALPLRDAVWRLLGRPPAQPGAATPATLSESLGTEVPLRAVSDHKPFTLGANRRGEVVVVVDSDVEDDARGPYLQRRMRETVYVPGRAEPLRDAVVYASFEGRQYSDSPRAIHEELVRRGLALDHLWVVADGRCRVPSSARVLREGSREYHEALARARYVVTNDHFPEWFRRRPDQICVQTWHGTPLKRIGLDVSEARLATRGFQRPWDQEQARNWQYVVSPNRFATPILRDAYQLEGELLETGYPRVDMLARGDRDDAGRRLRARLGLPDDKRVVLYAPTYRDNARDRRGRYRLDQALDIERLRAAVGEDTVVLFRKHHYVIDPVPATADGFVRDVSSYPDGTELLLAADVLVTDYSSMIVDFANTGRPILLFTYDHDAYRDEIRGLYVDFDETVPGPLLRTTDELAEALTDLDGVRERFAARYRSFRERFCELDDGYAAARVVDRVFAESGAS